VITKGEEIKRDSSDEVINCCLDKRINVNQSRKQQNMKEIC
jgi:hypothetical protein